MLNPNKAVISLWFTLTLYSIAFFFTFSISHGCDPVELQGSSDLNELPKLCHKDGWKWGVC